MQGYWNITVVPAYKIFYNADLLIPNICNTITFQIKYNNAWNDLSPWANKNPTQKKMTSSLLSMQGEMKNSNYPEKILVYK